MAIGRRSVSAVRLNNPRIFKTSWNADMLTIEIVGKDYKDTAYLFGSKDDWEEIIDIIAGEILR